ncbi:hypothetical protein ACFQGE_06575 [Halomicroarcula sp. GCM10025817]|uniref:hypothetical protein n=1 Tax=Haloarcula TaxID=2237 RepID=UPI0023E7AB24|nr:hypothetical protein [Halomicroarcula sp. SYNS111]
MAPSQLTGTVGDRLRWALSEAAVLAGILAFWLAVAVLLTVGLSVLATVLRATRIEQLRLVYELVTRVELLWPAVVALTVATAALYVLARVGTLLIARFRRGES